MCTVITTIMVQENETLINHYNTAVVSGQDRLEARMHEHMVNMTYHQDKSEHTSEQIRTVYERQIRTLSDSLERVQLRCSTVEGRYDALTEAHQQLQQSYTKSQVEYNTKIMEAMAESGAKV